jgi:polyisoprenoid-binding protein YceI
MNLRTLFAKTSLPLLLVGALGATPAAAAPETHEIDAVHSTVLFRVKHLNTGYSYGRFNEMSGTVVLDGGNPSACSVKVEVKAASVDTANAKRDDHLRGPDFFNVAQFPTITFASTAVSKAGEEAFDVTGDLTLLGVKKSVLVRMTRTGSSNDPRAGGLRTGFEGTLTIKRSDFGMKYGLEGLGDEVGLTLAFETLKK